MYSVGMTDMKAFHHCRYPAYRHFFHRLDFYCIDSIRFESPSPESDILVILCPDGKLSDFGISECKFLYSHGKNIWDGDAVYLAFSKGAFGDKVHTVRYIDAVQLCRPVECKRNCLDRICLSI